MCCKKQAERFTIRAEEGSIVNVIAFVFTYGFFLSFLFL